MNSFGIIFNAPTTGSVVQCAAFPVAAQDRQLRSKKTIMRPDSLCVSCAGACVSQLFSSSVSGLRSRSQKKRDSPTPTFNSDSIQPVSLSLVKTCLLGPAIDFFEFFARLYCVAPTFAVAVGFLVLICSFWWLLGALEKIGVWNRILFINYLRHFFPKNALLS